MGTAVSKSIIPSTAVSLNLGIICVATVLSASFPAERWAIVAATRSRCRSMQRHPARSSKDFAIEG